MYKVTKQFGLARRSGTFLLDAGVPPWRDGQTKVQLWLNVPERSGAKAVTMDFALLLGVVYFILNTIGFNPNLFLIMYKIKKSESNIKSKYSFSSISS